MKHAPGVPIRRGHPMKMRISGLGLLTNFVEHDIMSEQFLSKTIILLYIRKIQVVR